MQYLLLRASHRRRSTLRGVLVWICLAGSASADVESDRDAFLAGFAATPVTPTVHVIHGPSGVPSPENYGFMNNPGFVITTAGVVVIDPGSSRAAGEMVQANIARVTDQPVVAIFNTHVHGDHWLANQAFVERNAALPIYGSARFAEMVEEGAGQQWLTLIDTMTDGVAGQTTAYGPTHPVADGDVIAVGDTRFRVIRNEKAHTETDIVIVVEEPGVVFLGDNTFNGRIGRLDDGSLTGIIEVLDRVLELESRLFVPGHGPTGGAEIVQDYRGLIAGIYTGVEALYEQGMADFEMKPIIVEQLSPRFGDLSGFAEDIGRAISFAYLEVEENAF